MDEVRKLSLSSRSFCGVPMQFATLVPAPDTFVLIVPIIGLLAMCMLGLDERLATPKIAIPRRKKFCEIGNDGFVSFSDPDGRPCGINSGADSALGLTAGVTKMRAPATSNQAFSRVHNNLYC